MSADAMTVVLDLVPLQDRAAELDTIETPGEATYVGDLLHAATAMLDKVDATFDPLIAKAHETHCATLAEKRRNSDALVAIVATCKRLLADYATMQQRARDAERMTRELAQAADNALLEGAARAAEQAGDFLNADVLRAQQSHAPVVVGPPPPPVEGVVYRESWHARVDDLAALVSAAAGNPQLVALLLPDMKALNGMARSLKRRMDVPGVVAYATKDVARRRSS